MDRIPVNAVTTLTFYNGIVMPLLGLGTFELRGDACVAAVQASLAAGYRRIDTATAYRNHADVATGVTASGVPRNNIFITTKVAPGDHGETRAYEAVLRSLAELRTEYADLVLLHWPGVARMKPIDARQRELRIASYRALCRLLAEGRTRAIGVSNYLTRHLDELDAASLPTPHLNQVEVHPLLPQAELLAACAARRVAIEAYSPLGRGAPALLEHPRLLRVASAVRRPPPAVLLRWALQRGCAVSVKSANISRIKENMDIFDWALDDEAMRELDAIGHEPPAPKRYNWDPTPIV